MIPDALGQNGPRSYLFATLNDAELFASGGAPLNALVVRVDQHDVTIPISGSVSMGLNFGNAPYPWDVTGGMPWYRQGAEYPFANANYHPHFPISGRNMVVAWNALGHEQVDGVVTVDVAAVAAVLAAIGPVQSDGYGTVTAENVVRTLLVDAYREYPDWDVEARLARQGANAQLQHDLIDRLRDWRTALRAARALWDVIPSRHVQAYMADPDLQAAVVAIGADGALSVPSGDVLGVFAQSAPSKLAIFQKQRIERRVEIQPDGSAFVSPARRVHQCRARGPLGRPQGLPRLPGPEVPPAGRLPDPRHGYGPGHRGRGCPGARQAGRHGSVPRWFRRRGPLAGAGHTASPEWRDLLGLRPPAGHVRWRRGPAIHLTADASGPGRAGDARRHGDLPRGLDASRGGPGLDARRGPSPTGQESSTAQPR